MNEGVFFGDNLEAYKESCKLEVQILLLLAAFYYGLSADQLGTPQITSLIFMRQADKCYIMLTF